MKICSKCKEEKETIEFNKCKRNKDGLQSLCKECRKKWRQDNKDKIAEYKKQYWQNNKEELSEKHKQYWQENKEQKKQYYQENKEHYNQYYKNRKKNDIQYKLSCRLRIRIHSAIKNNQKAGSAVKDLGCSVAELKIHLESQFDPGMTWDNWSVEGWHIDHRIPVSSFDFTNEEEITKKKEERN